MSRWPAWGAATGAVVALAVLLAASVMLLDTEGANYKILVAVWLWLLPVLGLCSGVGYGAGKIAVALLGARGSDVEGGARANTR